MGRRAPLTALRRMGDINLTPLMDLTFILLITFIITFPLMEQGIPLDLPDGRATPQARDEEPREVSIDRNGQLFYEMQPVSPLELEDALAILAQREPNVRVYVRADRGVAYGAVVRVLQALQDVNITRVALVTRADS
ncbi:MAG: ExbD/TolR family protein [Kiritimatiellia bacterium]